MKTFDDLLNRSEEILAWGDNWDGQGSPRYQNATVVRAMTFLRLYHQYQSYPLPDLEPGPNGSIDLHWLVYPIELLINVPADEHAEITFYGECKEMGRIGPRYRLSGVLRDTEYGLSDQWLFNWLQIQIGR